MRANAGSAKILGYRMTSTVLHFVSNAEQGPLTNIENFINNCRQSMVLSAQGQFENNIWTFGYRKGRNSPVRAVFSSLEASKTASTTPTMAQPFLDFAKAVLIYLQDKRPVVSIGSRIMALRCIEAALQEMNQEPNPIGVTTEVLDTAVELARRQVSPQAAYNVAGQLQLVADLMREKGFVSFRQSWVHGLKRPGELGSRISTEALKARQEKLPSSAVLRALAGIFHESTKPRDILVSSVTALMLCAPERINEVLRLRRNCLVEGKGRFTGRLGLRWEGSKGAEDTTKWLPSQMTTIAKQAVTNLLRVTEPANLIACWYHENPSSIYLHPNAVHLRNQETLSLAELSNVLWGTETATGPANSWAKKKKLPYVSLGPHRIGYRFDDVEKAVLAMLPPTVPFVPGSANLYYKDALMLERLNEGHDKRGTWKCLFMSIDYERIRNSFRTQTRVSIFERFGFTEDDGSRINFKSNQLRHYLNMLAQIGGLSSAEIAIFSGRKDSSQNRVYDHMSSDEVQAPISQALKAGFTSQLVPQSQHRLIARKEFTNLGISSAHTTEFGWCMHNFAAEPCQMYRDCINCEEQECVKGDMQKVSNLIKLKTETEYLLKEAQLALTDKEYGVDIWVKHQTKTLERINALLAIINDPSTPDGARIRLNLANAPLITDTSNILPTLGERE